MNDRPRELGFTTPPTGTWVQTDRAAHEKWAVMAVDNPRASALLHVILHRMGRHNALVVSQKTLAGLAKCSVRTLQRSIETLNNGNWIEVRQIGESGTVNAYIVNDRVAWSGARDGIRYSMFTAEVIVSDREQPDVLMIEDLEPLLHIPSLLPGEQQLPTGEGLPPISQPSMPGMEPDLPARRR
jgi:hypothetical protein